MMTSLVSLTNNRFASVFALLAAGTRKKAEAASVACTGHGKSWPAWLKKAFSVEILITEWTKTGMKPKKFEVFYKRYFILA